MPPELTPEDEEFFEELLNKKGKSWLEKHLAELLPKKEPSTSGGDFLSYLQGQAEKTGATLAETLKKLETALELMTPEQRTQYKTLLTPAQSPKKEAEGDQNLPPKKEQQEEPKPKRKLFGRL